MKVGYNKVFGYYIEVSKSYYDQVPETYIRKQTLTNCERYITQELKDLEHTILSAQDRIVALEYELFCRHAEPGGGPVRPHPARSPGRWPSWTCLVSFAAVAAENNYCMPDGGRLRRLEITDGRHPVVEKMRRDVLFVPNDTYMGDKEHRAAIITGPNMAGKSTYMRQVALIVLMAQMGSFVPARAARIGVVDRIFTRIGASDDLAGGQSTFMVEMTEVAEILQHATPRSLLILDEIGRGTSTFDGMSIARAVLEYCADPKRLGAKTLFATHYHELTELEGRAPRRQKLQHRRQKARGRDHLPAQDRPRRGRPQLRHRGRQAGGPAAQSHSAGAGDPGRTGKPGQGPQADLCQGGTASLSHRPGGGRGAGNAAEYAAGKPHPPASNEPIV